MATYRIVDMYRKRKAVKGIHYDSLDNPILAYRVDKRHSLLFGLIHYWDYGAYNLCPEYLFPSVDKAEEAILKVDKSKIITILHEQLMKAENIKFKAKRLDNNTWVEGYFYTECGNTYIIENRQEESMLNRNITYEVDPSTVCQFTGLADKNGKEIWEGDYLTPINDSEAMKVIFKEGSFGFYTSYYGMRFHPLAQYDIREGNKLVELILINRKEGEK